MTEKCEAEPVVAIATGSQVHDAKAAFGHLKNLKKQHIWEPNLPDDVLGVIDDALDTTDAESKIGVTGEPPENSPYPNTETYSQTAETPKPNRS